MIRPFFESQDKDFTLFQGDSLKMLNDLQLKFDMIFADPPYFLSNGGKTISSGRIVSVNKGDWDKAKDAKEVDMFNREWLTTCRERLKDNGSLWVTGTYHNIFSVGKLLGELGFKIINVITWKKSDPVPNIYDTHFQFSAEYLIWAKKDNNQKHVFNDEWVKKENSGAVFDDVWELPTVRLWEKTCGKHPTQKPLCILYRIIMASTQEGDMILDPFAGSCTTGIAANLFGRKFVGFDQSKEFLDIGKRRRAELDDPAKAKNIMRRIKDNPTETMVLVNHARKSLRKKMIEKGICYLRAGNSHGSLEVTPGFERMRYVLIHTGGNDAKMFRLRKPGTFQIWTRETLEQFGFQPEHAPYYVVVLFDNTKERPLAKGINICQRINTYRAKVRPLSDFCDSY